METEPPELTASMEENVARVRKELLEIRRTALVEVRAAIQLCQTRLIGLDEADNELEKEAFDEAYQAEGSRPPKKKDVPRSIFKILQAVEEMAARREVLLCNTDRCHSLRRPASCPTPS